MFSAFKKFGRMGSWSSIPWTPTKLFAAGEAGGLWDFSTLANLYQDSAGTTPCTAVGQTIGLVLDTKNGTPQLGPELVTNGDFSNGATGWLLGTGWSVSGGAAGGSGVNDFQLIQNINSVANKTYQVVFTLTRSAGSVRVSVGKGYDTAYGIFSASGTYTVFRTCGADDTSLHFYPETNFTGSIDNISVRELPGNHLTQATSTKRPVLGRMPATGVRNLLTSTEDLTNTSAWPRSGAVATPNASTVTFEATGDYIYQTATGVTANMPTVSRLLLSGSGTITINFFDAGGSAETQLTLTGTPTWYTLTRTASGSAVNLSIQIIKGAGDTATSVTFGGIQLELGSTPTAYQKVGAAYDITESGVASVYTAYFDGVDDCLVSPSIDFSGTDAMSVFAGFRKTSDAARGMVLELSATTASNNGTFALTAPNAASATIVYESKGTALTDTSATIAAPADSVIAAVSDISADSNVLRRNGAEAESDTGDQGTGNFGNYPLYIGQRGASSLPYKGFMTALSTRGATTDADTIVKMEKWLAARTPGVTLP